MFRLSFALNMSSLNCLNGTPSWIKCKAAQHLYLDWWTKRWRCRLAVPQTSNTQAHYKGKHFNFVHTFAQPSFALRKGHGTLEARMSPCPQRSPATQLSHWSLANFQLNCNKVSQRYVKCCTNLIKNFYHLT